MKVFVANWYNRYGTDPAAFGTKVYGTLEAAIADFEGEVTFSKIADGLWSGEDDEFWIYTISEQEVN